MNVQISTELHIMLIELSKVKEMYLGFSTLGETSAYKDIIDR
jgi:hypothetical protein